MRFWKVGTSLVYLPIYKMCGGMEEKNLRIKALTQPNVQFQKKKKLNVGTPRI